MKRFRLTTAALVTGMILAAADNSGQIMLEAAKKKEVVDGDLNAAIQQYKAVVSKYAKERALVADALVHMAECYQKLGDGESRKIYEQVVRDYSDQKEAVTLARVRLGNEPRAAAGGMSYRQAWKLPAGGDIYGSVSRDGRYLPYVDWKQNGDLFLHDFLSGADRRLTNTGTDSMSGPHVDQFAEEYTFSPDGRQLAYSWFREDHMRYEVRLIDLKGEAIPQPRLLFDNSEVDWIAPEDWSPDGKWIAVKIQRKDNTAQIGLLAAADGSLRVLKSLDWRGVNGLLFSPDGKYLGYDLPESDTSQQRDVFVLAIDGTREIPAVIHRGQDLMMGWSPDGKRLLFASDRTGSMDLWGVPFGDGRIEGEPQIIKADIGRAGAAGLTRSGSMYLWTPGSVQERVQVQMASFDPGTGKLLSAPIDLAPEYSGAAIPMWSPDGKYLAYLSERGRFGSSNEVMIIQPVETPELVRELRVKLTNIYSVGWGPDGQSFLLQGRDFKGRWGIFQMDARTGDVSPLILDQRREIEYPGWSVDGKSLYFSRRISGGKEMALIQRDVASGIEKELVRRAFIAPDMRSPDGRYLAPSTVDSSSGSRVKLLVPLQGGEPRELMRVPAEIDASDLANYGKGVALLGAQWTPDSRSFFTLKRFNGENSRAEVWRVPIDGGSPVRLDVKVDPKYLFRLSPDGRRIVLLVPEKGSPRGQIEVWALENFLPKSGN